MRRVFQVAVLSIVVHGLLASQASAWWDGVEHMSGPGPFYGWDIQLRLFCLVETKTTTETKQPDGRVKREQSEPSTRLIVPPPLGIILSACKSESEEDLSDGKEPKRIRRTKHRAAFDIGARFVWAIDNPEFAGGKRISLTTLEPAVSVPLLSKFNKGDVVDVGFGAGVYWISSTEFEAFHGAFLEPIRLDFHPPFAVRMKTYSAAIPRARVGLLVFPSGFERAAFAPTHPLPARISRDWVKTLAVEWDLEPLLRKLQ